MLHQFAHSPQFPEVWMRSWTALVIVALSLWQLRFPGSFYGIAVFFKGLVSELSPAQKERLERVLAARSVAEGASKAPERIIGIFGLVMAALECVPTIPFAIPYALYCLAGALTMLAAYLHVRRNTEKRVAPLVRRSPFDAMPPLLIVALFGCLAGVGLYGAYPPFRAGAIGVAISMLVLMWIAWRIASSQAVMLGQDPQLEYAVDERLRLCRALGTAELACAPAAVLVGATVAWAMPLDATAVAALALTYASCALAVAVRCVARRRIAAKLLNGAGFATP